MIGRKTGQFFCLFPVERFDVQKDEICFHRRLKSGAFVIDPGCVDRDMQTFFVKCFCEGKNKLCLTERLAAGDRHAAAGDVGFVSQDLFDHLIDGVLFPALESPGIRVMAELAS